MSVLDHALRYHDYGWCVIPVKVGTKIPACRSWKEFQTVRPSTTKLRRWFRNESNSLAIIAGPVSGGLVVRDFDDLDSYKSWATDQPVLAQTLPTVETGRPGRHVYFRSEVKYGIIHGGDGELRSSGYCVAPPSSHESGKHYRWLIDPQGELPVIDDLLVAGLLPCNREDREDREDRGGQRTLKRGSDTSDLVVLNDAQIENAIANCLPNKESQRHRLVFELVRELKAIPWLAEADPMDLEWIVREWHRRAKPVIRTKDFEESWLDFVEGWAMIQNNPIPIVAELLTEKQAAAFLGISPRKLWSMRAAGEIKYVRIGRCIRYHIDDLRMWIEENKEGGDDR